MEGWREGGRRGRDGEREGGEGEMERWKVGEIERGREGRERNKSWLRVTIRDVDITVCQGCSFDVAY